MEIVALLFKQNVVMLCYLLIGYLLFKKRLLTVKGSAEMGKLLLYVIMPFTIVKSYIRDYSSEMLGDFIISFFTALVTLLFSIIISSVVFKNKSAIKQFGAAFSNAGFIGIPLVQMTMGDEAVFYVASFVALLNIFQWTYGVAIMTKDKSIISYKKNLTNPIVISFLIGILLFFLPVQLPDILTNVISSLAGMNGPLAMLVLGTYLAQISLNELFTDKDTYVCTSVRLAVIPVLTIFLLMFVPEKYEMIKLSVLLVSSAPVGSNVAIFAQLFDKEYTGAVKDICLSTVCSMFTMPLIVSLTKIVW